MDHHYLEYKTLYSKAKYLTLEYELTESKFSTYKVEFLKEISKKVPEDFGPSNPIDDIVASIEDILSEDINSLDNVAISKSFKSLYKKIMLIVHPDKIIGMKDEGTRLSYIRLSERANQAATTEDWFTLFDICNELKIDDIDINQENIVWLKGYCESKISESESLTSSYPWVWFNSDEKTKHLIEKAFIEKKTKKV